MVKAPKNKSFKFGESFDQLNKIVEQLESGSVDLDKALELYEQGLQIAKSCKKHLAEVENRVKIIRDTYDMPQADE